MINILELTSDNSDKSKDIHRMIGFIAQATRNDRGKIHSQNGGIGQQFCRLRNAFAPQRGKTGRLTSSQFSCRLPLNFLIQVALQHRAQALIL